MFRLICSDAQHRLIGHLSRSEAESAHALVDVLDVCSDAAPCGSAACLRCGASFQQAAVSVVERFIGDPSRFIRGRKTAVTIVPPYGCVEPGALTADTCWQVSAEISAALQKLRLPPMVMGFEISFNEDTTDKVAPHWCIHAHGIGLDWLPNIQVKGLKKEFPSSSLVKRPIQCIPLDNNAAGILYANKLERFRRITFLEKNHPARKPYRDTKSA